jgi:hydrogenase maturation protein HypF
MAENGLANQRVLGVAFDGTGFGSDGKLWGGEFLLCDYRSFRRRAGLREIPLLGAEQAIREPARLAFAWLYLAYAGKPPARALKILRINKNRQRVFRQMLAGGFNSPFSSGMGRLFDAVASLILGRQKASFEAELAIELERIAAGRRPQAAGYKFKITKAKQGHILDPAPVFRQMIRDLQNRVAKGKIAYRFHLSVAEAARKTCLKIRRQERVNTVCLSGGVFQNQVLVSLLRDILSEDGFRVLTQDKLSCNDAGISLGQAVAAAHQYRVLK